MFRSCGEAPASSASRTSGSRSVTVGSAASSSIVVSAPTRSVPSPRVIARNGRRVMSTSRSGSSTPSFRTRSSWVVPPARYRASGPRSPTPPPRPRRRRERTRTVASLLASSSGDVSDRGDDVRVRPAPAEIAAHELPDLRIGSRSVLIQQTNGRHDLPRGAVAALKAVMPDEGLLHRVQTAVAREPLDRRHLPPIALRRQSQAGQDPLAVDQHGACPARPLIAPLLRAGQLEHLAQRVEQCHPTVQPQPTRVPVHLRHDVYDCRASYG